MLVSSPNHDWTDRWTPLREHAEQRRLWWDKSRFKIVPAGRRSGKTELAKRKLVESLFRKTWHGQPGRFFAAAPTRDQAKRIWWQDLNDLLHPDWKAVVSSSELKIRTGSGAELWVIGLDKPMRMEGVSWDGGVIDEYADCKCGTFDGGTVGGPTELTTAALTAGTATALTAAGVGSLWDLDDATADPTFNPYGAVRPLAAAGNVAVLGSAAKLRMNLAAAETFVVFGLGRKCTMIGTTMTDPPVHFADEQNNTPDKVYGRKGVVFLVTKNGGAARSKAKFVTTVSFHEDQVISSDDHLKEYYGLTNDN